MADKTNQALKIAGAVSVQAALFLNAKERLNDLLTYATETGLNMADYDASFAAAEELKHMDGLTINKLAVIIPALNAWLEGQSTGGTTYSEVLYSLRLDV